MPERSLSAWRDRHVDLERRLRSACRIAPERDPTRFGEVWRPFEDALRTHLALEEQHLLPAFDTLTDGVAPNQLPGVVRADHVRILAAIDGVVLGPHTARAVTARAERLVVLLQVLDHHDRREAAGMFAVLDRRVSPEVRARWLGSFAEREAEVGAPVDLPPLPAPPMWIAPDRAPIDALADTLAQDGDLVGVVEALPALPGPNGQRVGVALRRAVLACVEAPTLVERRDLLLDALDAVRRWRAVAGARASGPG